MMKLPSNPSEKKCEYCGTDTTYIAVTKNGTPYPKWNSNPFKGGIIYAENVTKIYCITRLSLQFMFVKVFALIELQSEFVTSEEARQVLKKVRLHLIVLCEFALRN